MVNFLSSMVEVECGDKEKKNLENIEWRLLLRESLDGEVAHTETGLIGYFGIIEDIKV